MVYFYGGGGGLSTGAYIGIAVACFVVALILAICGIYYRRRHIRILRQHIMNDQQRRLNMQPNLNGNLNMNLTMNQNFDQVFQSPGYKPENGATQVTEETTNVTNNTAFMYVPPETPSAPPPTYDASRNDTRVRLMV